MHVSAPGSDPQQVTVDELLNHIQHQLTQDGDTFSGSWNYSINGEGKVEFMFYNGLYILSLEEFEELKQKSPDVEWKEYPNDWAGDEIDEVIDYLTDRDLVQGLKDDHDYDGALKTLMIYLGAEPEDGGDNFPSWLQNVPHDEMEKLAKGVLKVLDILPPNQTPTDMVDKMLDD